jgi:general secretion pathway protein G
MNKKFQIPNSKFQIHGFTLIELLVVISILGILASLLISNVTGARERARDSQRKSDLLQVKEALKMYYNDFDEYPTGSSTVIGCGTTLQATECPWGEEFKRGNTTYMKILPKDPSWTETSLKSYSYTSPWGDEGADNFLLCADLENESDQDIAKSQARCSGPAGYYCVCVD